MLAFERYFRWADTMREHFEDRRPNYPDDRRAHWEPYMAYWYGALYAVTEGWRALRFRDEVIGALLKDQEKMALLRRYRARGVSFSTPLLRPALRRSLGAPRCHRLGGPAAPPIRPVDPRGTPEGRGVDISHRSPRRALMARHGDGIYQRNGGP
jgi:hypothetical protein